MEIKTTPEIYAEAKELDIKGAVGALDKKWVALDDLKEAIEELEESLVAFDDINIDMICTSVFTTKNVFEATEKLKDKLSSPFEEKQDR